MITASKGTVFSYAGETPKTQICIQGVAKAWPSGNIYISEEDAKDLVEALQKALEENNSAIF